MRWLKNPSRSRASRVVAAATAVAAGVLVGTGQAGSSGRSAPRAVSHHHPAAVQVKCGDTITTDARLTRDLNNCPAEGVIIGAAGVTLDLEGYTIDGVGAGIGVSNVRGVWRRDREGRDRPPVHGRHPAHERGRQIASHGSRSP